MPGVEMRSSGVECSARRSSVLWSAPAAARAVVGVDHEEVHGVRAHVEHSEPHGSTLPAAGAGDRAAVCAALGAPEAGCPDDPASGQDIGLSPCPRCRLDFPRPWVEFPDPPTQTSCTAAT